MMSEELINEFTARYVKGILRPFKKIAERAYKDGLQDAMKFIRMRHEMDNDEFDYGHDVKYNSEE